jgi:ABC-type multidrug transport system fused ATPase/permease subunit
MALDGRISVGQLAAVFGFATMMAVHAGFFIGMAQSFIAAHVAAKRLTAFFATESDIDTGGSYRDMDGELHDPESGLAIAPGGLTVVVGADTGTIAAAFERLARYRDSRATWGGMPVADTDLAELRRRVLLLHDDYLFAQTLGETLRVDPDTALRAIATARAEDVYTSLGSDFDARVDDSGRNLSGGQRQRLRLARAVAADPETFLAVEPTSAVDAHTESLIAERLTAERAGRTTAIATASPLWLAHADQVAWMVDGKVRAVGTHAELAADPDYRALTSRQESAR